MKLEKSEGGERYSEDMQEIVKPLKSVFIRIAVEPSFHGSTSGIHNNKCQCGLSKNNIWRRWFKYWPM